MNTAYIKARLFLHDKELISDYHLLGNDENSLTFALGHVLSRDSEFCSAFIRWCGFKGITSTQACNAEIRLQSYHIENGITDVEIFLPNRLQIIVEAKVGGDFPGHKQIEKYFSRLSIKMNSKLVVLTKASNDRLKSDLEKEFSRKVEFRSWNGVLDLSKQLAKHEDSTYDIQSFSNFLKEVYGMTLDVQEEVWIVSLAMNWKAKSEDMTVAEFHVKNKLWVMGERNPRRALYMGFRYDGHLQYIGRIKRIDYGVKASEIGPKIAMEFWGKKDEPYGVVRLENMVRFPNKLPSGNLHSRHVYCDFDLLLTSKSVLEAANLTRKRREKSVASKS